MAEKTTTTNMKVWKIVSGILSIIFSCIVLLQSCAAGVVETIDNAETADGSLGLMVAILLLAGGIMSLALTKSIKGGNIAIAIVFALAALCGYAGGSVYGDIVIWATWALICAVLAVVAFVTGKNKELA